MNKILSCMACMLYSVLLYSQSSVSFMIKGPDGQQLNGASLTVKGSNKGALADTSGIVTISLPAGSYTFRFSFVDKEAKELKLSLPYTGTQPIEIVLEAHEEEEEEEEVIIQSTRSSRTIRDIPTRVEFIAGEELDEKANMKSGDIRMVLTESTGIQTQQTSATSANASIRIQGLDGRYTQVLKDGIPLYAGFSGGLGLLQTPPLDLKQIEVIKGAASTLYGGGAIAGLVNLISKTPGEERELKFHVDLTSAGGINTSGFYGERYGKTGLTVFASRNSNAPYDPSDIGLTAIPRFERYTLNPKFFVYLDEKTTFNIGVNLTTEDRKGGDIEFIKGNKPNGFYETNTSERISSQFFLEHRFTEKNYLTIKNSFNGFIRAINSPSFNFKGKQGGSFTEVAFASHGVKSEWIAGVNYVSENFAEKAVGAFVARDYQQHTVGGFVQNNLRVSDRFSLETGLRADMVNDYGFALLPRISALFRFTPKLSSRIGGGLGYKTPTIFTEETERMQYQLVLPVDGNFNELERSIGVNADINYKTTFGNGEFSFSINQLFFYTVINKPLLLQPDGSYFRLVNVPGHIDTKGIETNVKLGYSDFKLFLGYTFTDVYLHQGVIKTQHFLTPQHRVNAVLLYEVEDKWKVGLEGYYFSKQLLSDGNTGKPYWITGFMVEKLWEKSSVYINFENFLDARQTRFDSIHTGPIANPVFRDIYAPLDGFVVNGGFKLRL